jgi:hypothetical protein
MRLGAWRSTIRSPPCMQGPVPGGPGAPAAAPGQPHRAHLQAEGLGPAGVARRGQRRGAAGGRGGGGHAGRSRRPRPGTAGERPLRVAAVQRPNARQNVLFAGLAGAQLLQLRQLPPPLPGRAVRQRGAPGAGPAACRAAAPPRQAAQAARPGRSPQAVRRRRLGGFRATPHTCAVLVAERVAVVLAGAVPAASRHASVVRCAAFRARADTSPAPLPPPPAPPQVGLQVVEATGSCSTLAVRIQAQWVGTCLQCLPLPPCSSPAPPAFNLSPMQPARCSPVPRRQAAVEHKVSKGANRPEAAPRASQA